MDICLSSLPNTGESYYYSRTATLRALLSGKGTTHYEDESDLRHLFNAATELNYGDVLNFEIDHQNTLITIEFMDLDSNQIEMLSDYYKTLSGIHLVEPDIEIVDIEFYKETIVTTRHMVLI